MGNQTLGDFVMYHLVAASVTRALPGARLVAVYRADRPYKDLITLMNPHVTAIQRLRADPAVVLPLDALETGLGGLPPPDLFLPPSALDAGRMVGAPPALRIPDELAPALAQALIKLGVDPRRWLVALHLREAGYVYRQGMDASRCVDPLTYGPAIDRIIDGLGGQVVRLGDPSMTPLPARPGLVDLSRVADSFPLQAFATSRCRFFLGTDTGPTQLATALKVPTASTNAMGMGVWNDGDLVLFKRFLRPDGRSLDKDEILSLTNFGMQVLYPRDGITVADNTPEALVDVVDRMVAATTDCPGWRDHWPAEAPPPVGVSLPLEWRSVRDTVDLVVLTE